MNEQKWRVIAFLFVFLFISTAAIAVFQYVSLSYYREIALATERSLEEFKEQFSETQNRASAYEAQRDYYKQQANYYMQQVQGYQQKLRKHAGGESLGAQTVTAQMQVPAVRAEDEFISSFVGVPMTLVVEVRPGDGSIFVNTEPLMGLYLQDSARTAAQVAQNYTGFSLADRDLVISAKAPFVIEAVDGPSAGASMTLLMIAAIEEREIRPDVMLTGTIEPDGSIGRVGGILAKAEASAETGATTFLIPEGQARQVLYEQVVRELLPGFRLVTTEPKWIDIKDHAEKKWGLEVIEVGNVTDALEYVTEVSPLP